MSTLQRFQFPSEGQLALLKFPQTRYDLIDLMHRLKKQPQYIEKKLKFLYTVMPSHPPIRKHHRNIVFKFYFNCCHLKPRLVFHEIINGQFILDEPSSTFYHEHGDFQSNRKKLFDEAQKHQNCIQKAKRVRQIPNYREDSEVKIEEEDNSLQKNMIDTTIIDLCQMTKKNQIEPSQVCRDCPKFHKQYTSSVNQRSDQSKIYSLLKKKKIYKSRLLFDRRSNGDSQINRPWIFRPHRYPQTTLRKTISNIEEVKIQNSVENSPFGGNLSSQPERFPPMSYHQLFDLPSNEKVQITRRKNLNTQRIFQILIEPTKNDNSGSFEPITLDEPPLHQQISCRSQQKIPEQAQIEGIQQSVVSLAKAVYHTFQWFKKFTSKIFEQTIGKTLNLQKIRTQLKRQKPFSIFLPDDKEKSKKFKTFWQESNYLLLKTNNFFDFQLSSFSSSDANLQSRHDRFFNKFFISKKIENIGNDSENSAKLISDSIYLAIYPLKLVNEKIDLEVLIAYQLSTRLEAKLIWFSIFDCFQSNKTLPSLTSMREKFVIKSIVQILLKSIKFMKLEKVHFVYTTFNMNLIQGLNQTFQKVKTNGLDINISFSIHISCIQKFLELEEQRSIKLSVILRIFSDRQLEFKEQGQTSQETFYFKNLLEIKNSKHFAKGSQMNPRSMFENFKLIRDKCSILEKSKDRNLDLSFLSSQFYSEKDKILIKDPVNQINQIFTRFNTFEGFEELFPFILTIFNANFSKGLKILQEHMIVPNNFMWKENEFPIIHDIFNAGNYEKQYFKNKIFKTPALDFEKVVKSCPRILIQTFYRLVYFASLLSFVSERTDIKFATTQKKEYKVFNSEKETSLYVFCPEKSTTEHESQISDFFMHTQNEFKLMEKWKNIKSVKKIAKKKWKCECKFYKQTGIPCEHEIFCAIMFKTSVLEEINSKWKEFV